jgi:hypothetical protein
MKAEVRGPHSISVICAIPVPFNVIDVGLRLYESTQESVRRWHAGIARGAAAFDTAEAPTCAQRRGSPAIRVTTRHRSKVLGSDKDTVTPFHQPLGKWQHLHQVAESAAKLPGKQYRCHVTCSLGWSSRVDRGTFNRGRRSGLPIGY